MTCEARMMKFDRADLTWKYTDSRVCEQPVMTFLDDQAKHVLVYTHNGTMEITAADMQDRDVLMAKLAARVRW